MRRLFEHLSDRALTLTIYDYNGTEDQLTALSTQLAGQGIAVRTAETTGNGPANVCVLHRGEEVLGTVPAAELLPEGGIEAAFTTGVNVDTSVLPVETSDLLVSPGASRERMVGISREFERRALRTGDGRLRSGFQRLSVLAESDRTRSVYERLSEAGVDVLVFGYPDVDPGDQPFEVVADEEGRFRDYWFLLYDGGGDPGRMAALLAEERAPDAWNAFWTDDAETVEEVLALAGEQYPGLAL